MRKRPLIRLGLSPIMNSLVECFSGAHICVLKQTAAMSVFPTNSVWVERFSYVNSFSFSFLQICIDVSENALYSAVKSLCQSQYRS